MDSRLAESGLSSEYAKILHLEPGVTPPELGIDPPVETFRIPYLEFKSKQELATFRWRIDVKQVTKGFAAKTKLPKYMQPAGTPPAAYFPPFKVNWEKVAKNSSMPIFITEGELKAAKGVAEGLTVIGLGGVESWHSTKRGWRLLPELMEFDWLNRHVFICFDSDAINNPNVRAAEAKLSRELAFHGAVPSIIRLPQEGPDKVGLDDYLKTHSIKEFQELVTKAEKEKTLREIIKMNGEFALIKSLSKIYWLDNGRFLRREEFVSTICSDRLIDVTPDNSESPKRIVKKIADLWMESPQRAKYDIINYKPGAPRVYEEMKGDRALQVLNTWERNPIEPVKGDVSHFTKLLDFLCSREEDNPAARKYLEQWLAYPLKYPGTKIHTAVIIWSTFKGNGKSMLGLAMRRLYGKSNSSAINHSQLEGQFNSNWIAQKQFTIGNEITGNDSRQFANKIKDLITSPTQTCHPKFVDAYEIDDYNNYYFNSNECDAFFLEEGDRRFFVIEAPSSKLEEEFYSEFFERFVSELSTIGASALMYHLLNDVDLTGFKPEGRAPTTLAKEFMMRSGQSSLADWIIDFRDKPEKYKNIGSPENVVSPLVFTSEELFDKFRASNPDDKRVTKSGLQKKLKSHDFEPLNGGRQVNFDGGREYLWARVTDGLEKATPEEIRFIKENSFAPLSITPPKGSALDRYTLRKRIDGKMVESAKVKAITKKLEKFKKRTEK